MRWAEQSLELVPDSLLSGKALAVGLQFSGELREARDVLAGLAERSPYDPQVLHRLGGIQFLLGDSAEATENLEKAAGLDPDNVDIWLTLRYVYEQTGDAAGAARADARVADLQK